MATGTRQGDEAGRAGEQARPVVPVPWIIAALVFALLVSLVTGWFFFMTQDITLLLFGGLLFLPVYVLVLYWVWRDAEEQDMQAFLWVVVVVFLFILGLVIYLVLRELKGLRKVG